MAERSGNFLKSLTYVVGYIEESMGKEAHLEADLQ